MIISGWWWLEHDWIIFPCSWEWKNHPNWLSYFSQGLKPPARFGKLGRCEMWGNYELNMMEHVGKCKEHIAEIWGKGWKHLGKCRESVKTWESLGKHLLNMFWFHNSGVVSMNQKWISPSNVVNSISNNSQNSYKLAIKLVHHHPQMVVVWLHLLNPKAYSEGRGLGGEGEFENHGQWRGVAIFDWYLSAIYLTFP